MARANRTPFQEVLDELVQEIRDEVAEAVRRDLFMLTCHREAVRRSSGKS